MNINIALRLDPTKYGKSGSFAVCVFCAKGTEYQFCCDRLDGLIEIDYDNVDQVAREYSFTDDQFDELYEALKQFIESKENN